MAAFPRHRPGTAGSSDFLPLRGHRPSVTVDQRPDEGGQVVEADTKSCKFSAVDRQTVLGFLLGKVPAKDMPLAA